MATQCKEPKNYSRSDGQVSAALRFLQKCSPVSDVSWFGEDTLRLFRSSYFWFSRNFYSFLALSNILKTLVICLSDHQEESLKTVPATSWVLPINLSKLEVYHQPAFTDPSLQACFSYILACPKINLLFRT